MSRLVDLRVKLIEKMRVLSEEMARIDQSALEVPGMDRIKQLELDVEKMKLKLNEAVNINQNFAAMLLGLNEDQIKYDVAHGSSKTMLRDAEEEFENAVQVSASAEKANSIMQENLKFRKAQIQDDQKKRHEILAQRKEQVKVEREKTDYVCSQIVHQDFDTKLIAEDKVETAWSSAMELYQEKISLQLKIHNPTEFALKAIQSAREKEGITSEDAVTVELKRKLNE